MTAATRLYKVTMGKEIHLVDATGKVQAISHVARSKVHAELVTALEAAQLTLAGIHPEFAGKENPEAVEEVEQPGLHAA